MRACSTKLESAPVPLVPQSNETQNLTTNDLVEDAWTRGSLPDSEADDLVGTTLNGTYRIERILGSGGMGRVYLASHTRIGQKRVAVKVLHDEHARNAQVLARFQREAETAAAVSHPNVVTVLDIDRTPQGLPYLVCEYLEGVELGEHLRNVGKLETGFALHVARELCKGLAAAHRSGVIHRDLKPQNIFLVGDFSQGVSRRPPVKILDFGLSRFLDQSQNDGLTKTGFIMGTPAYMAPEQARGQRADHRVDVYGVGAILYAALTGRPPFEGESPQATVLAVLNAEPPRPRALQPTISPELELTLERALARDPTARFADMDTLERALAELDPEDTRALLNTRAESPEPAPLQRRAAASSHEYSDVHRARPRLVLFLLWAVLLLVAGAVTMVPGIELATGYTFNRVELGLLLLGIFGSSATPAILWLTHVRRRIWDNSSRVLVLLGEVRLAVLSGALAYGLGTLALHLIDDFVLRILSESKLRPVGATWTGWNLLLPVVSVLAALAVVVHRRIAISARPGFRRVLSLGLATLVSLGLLGATVYGGIRWKQHAERTASQSR
jgi:serine/threonine-protein kinase